MLSGPKIYNLPTALEIIYSNFFLLFTVHNETYCLIQMKIDLSNQDSPHAHYLDFFSENSENSKIDGLLNTTSKIE